MNEKTARQIAEMKNQTIGVEVEMNSITRQKAAKVAAAYFGTGRYENTAGRNGYSTWSAWDADGREWKFCNNFFRQISNGNLTLCCYINLLSDGLIRLCDCYKTCCCIFHIIKISRWCQRTKFDFFFTSQKLCNNRRDYRSCRLSWSKRIKRTYNCNRKIKAAVKLTSTVMRRFIKRKDFPTSHAVYAVSKTCLQKKGLWSFHLKKSPF